MRENTKTILLLFAFMWLSQTGIAQTSPSTGSCLPAGCADSYSASYIDPAIEVPNSASNSFSFGPNTSYWQQFGNTPIGTAITCACFQVRDIPVNPLVFPNTITINVYAYNSADPFNLANIGTPIGSGTYAFTGTEADRELVCVDITGDDVSLSCDDDTFVVQYLDQIGTFNAMWFGRSGNPSPWMGSVTYVSGDGTEPQLASNFFTDLDFVLEINGCVLPCEADAGEFPSN